MTLTRGWRQVLIIAVMILIANVLMVWGNQRQAHAVELPSFVPECADTIDNDGDGYADFVPVTGGEGYGPDPDCEDVFDNDEGPFTPPPAAQCEDGEDNDGDGFTDEEDPNCHTDGDPSNEESYDESRDESDSFPGQLECWDGIDNDSDGKTDWNPTPGEGDPDCATPLDDSEAGEGGGEEETACSDGEDNDSDGKIDLEDPGCENAEDNDEADPSGGEKAACEDGLDNDSDGKIDLEDPGCTEASDDDETDSNGGGGNGGDEPQCNDGIDNDDDGRTDLDDDGCESASDDDETDPESTQSTGGSGGSRRGGLVLGAATYFSCDQFLTAYIRSGYNNDLGQVARLQYFLNEFEGHQLKVNGIYDAATLAAVNFFQQKYASEVLTPWGINAPTGYVYLTTRKKINELYCKGTNQFPLTAEQQQIIERARMGGSVLGTQTQTQTPVLTIPTLEEIEQDAEETTASEEESTSASNEEREIDGQPERGFWGTIRDFVGGLFGR